MGWFKGLSIVWKLIAALVVLAVLFAGYQAVSSFFSSGAKTEARLGKNQTGAAIETGRDAVGTIGNRQAADEAGRQTVEETRDEIRKQTTATGVTGAGRRGLCGLASHRGNPECVQPSPPR